ncbi:MAG: primosomal protein N' [Anderseniella sp.]|jgi:primosomal protein N' (replication factor Y)|nr:primosomal protein N' [Anderseniella sp.]
MPSDSTVQVLLPLALEGAYTYAVPQGMTLAEGDYVRVPLGPRQMIGVVWQVGGAAPAGAKLRAVAERYDTPPMPALHRQFIDWVARYYLENPGQVLRMCLRVPEALAGERQQIAWRASGREPDKLTAQRARVMEIASDGLARRAAELAAEAGVSAGVVKGLQEQGALEPVALPALEPFRAPEPGHSAVRLNTGQQEAARLLRAAVTARGFSVSLLDGVTGSGKTEVYFEAMAAALARGQQVLLLLPEIALTGPFLRRVEERFGVAPAEWHSAVRPRERERVWRGVATGEAKIVVGARSALFLPWARPGLIVVDEEHEPAFKQEEGVNYHARDMAVLYGSLGGFPVVLSSATPSLESLWNAGRGRYGHVRLEARYGKAVLPEVSLLDMRRQNMPGGEWLAPDLVQAVAGTLAAGDQALLFLNRRGYAPLTLCRTCGHRLACPSCASWLVEHRFRGRLVCHHCGHEEPVPKTCPECGAEDSLVACGPGVERLAEEASSRFPEARIAILSSDLSRGNLLGEMLRDIAKGEYSLIIGTQLVAKGHHFPGLTLAGVVDADLALETTDPRAGERTWQMLAQVSGRAGRGDRPGRAIVQTYMPDHPLMRSLAAQDRDSFLDHESEIRQRAMLPPFGRMAGIIVSGEDREEASRFAQALARSQPQASDVQVLGPAPAPLAMVRGRHRFRLLVMCAREVDIQAYLRQWLGGVKARGSLRLNVDVDPYSFL